MRDDYGKLWFNIVDYTGSATRMFADPRFRRRSGADHRRGTRRRPANPTHRGRRAAAGEGETGSRRRRRSSSRRPDERRKFYFDGGQVEVAAHLVYELDPDGKQLRVVRYTDYAAESVRTLCPSAPELRETVGRSRASAARSSSGWQSAASNFDELADAAEQPEADPFDLLCHLAFNAPLRTRRERAQRLRTRAQGLLRPDTARRRGRFSKNCWRSTPSTVTRSSLLPDVLQVPPISSHGHGRRHHHALRRRRSACGTAVTELQALLYAA